MIDRKHWIGRARLHAARMEAMVFLCAARAAVACLPFRYWHIWLGRLNRQPQDPAGAVADEAAARGAATGRLVEQVARRAPIAFKCLPRAMAARAMLGRRGIATQLHYGARRSAAGEPLQFHAWLCCGDRIVTGAAERQAFAVFSKMPAAPASAQAAAAGTAHR